MLHGSLLGWNLRFLQLKEVISTAYSCTRWANRSPESRTRNSEMPEICGHLRKLRLRLLNARICGGPPTVISKLRSICIGDTDAPKRGPLSRAAEHKSPSPRARKRNRESSVSARRRHRPRAVARQPSPTDGLLGQVGNPRFSLARIGCLGWVVGTLPRCREHRMRPDIWHFTARSRSGAWFSVSLARS